MATIAVPRPVARAGAERAKVALSRAEHAPPPAIASRVQSPRHPPGVPLAQRRSRTGSQGCDSDSSAPARSAAHGTRPPTAPDRRHGDILRQERVERPPPGHRRECLRRREAHHLPGRMHPADRCGPPPRPESLAPAMRAMAASSAPCTVGPLLGRLALEAVEARAIVGDERGERFTQTLDRARPARDGPSPPRRPGGSPAS